ncbi:MAG: bifunctional orotidine-5'-phosphate decarboxylase/orotate phosphoribosyltransferase [Cyanobacteria bacterium J06560_6]
MNFFSQLAQTINKNQSLLYVSLDPNPEVWANYYKQPLSSENSPEANRTEQGLAALKPFQTWLQFVIAETAELVCAYKLNPAFYQLLGAAGTTLMHQTLSLIPSNIPVILDTHHSDLNSAAIFAQTVFQSWQIDAVTLNAYAGQDVAVPFLMHPNSGIFVLCTTTNPAAQTLQTYPAADRPFYLHLVEEVRTWGTAEQLGLEVGAPTPAVLANIRAAAPERTILARSIWKENNKLVNILEAGLNSEGSGLLIPVPPDLVNPALVKNAPENNTSKYSLSKAVQALRTEVNEVRTTVAARSPACPVWISDVCLLNPSEHTSLILQLYDIGCLQFGEFVQASGETFPYYIDLRTIISNPQIFEQVIGAYAKILKTLEFERIAGLPYGALPTATGLSLRLNYPMIFPRKEVKAHGARRLVEGSYSAGETIVVVDDILISGKSAIEGAKKLESVGLEVQDIVVLIDHEKGVMKRLARSGYTGHAVLSISEIADTLFAAGRLSAAQLRALA